MRLALLAFLVLMAVPTVVQAQSILDNIPAPPVDEDSGDTAQPPTKEMSAPPPAETYTVADVNADVTADTAAHARDQALMQAERAALSQLCARLNVTDATAKMSDDAVAALVQSFEVQSERLSAVRYIGVFTIGFKPAAVQKKLGGAAPAADSAKTTLTGPVSHLTVAAQTDSLASWAQIRRRLAAAPPVARIDVLDLGRGLSHIDLSYAGSTDDLKQALTAQGLVLRQNEIGIWELYDGSMVTR